MQIGAMSFFLLRLASFTESYRSMFVRFIHRFPVLTTLLGTLSVFVFRDRYAHNRIQQLSAEIVEMKQRYQDLALAFADQAVMAKENARLREEAQKAAAGAERERLARDLHDAVTQTLFSAGLIAEILPRLYAENPVEGEKKLEDLRRLTRGALAEMRTLLTELRPAALVETPFCDLLHQLIEAATGRTRLIINLSIQGETVLPPDVQTNLYRIAQEALSNVVKHARAEHLWVALNYQTDSADLSIEDDGRGFDLNNIPADHFGIRIMNERAASIQAALTINSTFDKGSRIAVRWPGS